VPQRDPDLRVVAVEGGEPLRQLHGLGRRGDADGAAHHAGVLVHGGACAPRLGEDRVRPHQ
jgi:hypothetical protein